MIDTLVQINEFFKNLVLSVGTILKVIILSKFKKSINNIKPINNKVIILANGPSVNTFDYNEFDYSGYDFLTVNFSTSSKLFTDTKPKYHIVNAPELWEDNVTENYIKARLKLFNELKEKVNWPLYLFIPFASRKYLFWQKIISDNKYINIIYFNPTPVEGLKIINRIFFRNNLGMPRPHNVVIPSLMLLINIGYKNIFLLGVDHSWLKEISVNENNEALICQKHFYDYDHVKAKPMSHLGVRPRKLHEILHKFYLTFKGYFEINEYAISRNIKIYNATDNSFIDAFERKKIDSNVRE
ncbi:MAG: hypothetical protein JW717_03210 [Marinilabiliaceae bacterium]|nr:hypothetical protein [Marinilabiliaceae bacterium]